MDHFIWAEPAVSTMEASRLFALRMPDSIQENNGGQFILNALDKWAYETGCLRAFPVP